MSFRTKVAVATVCLAAAAGPSWSSTAAAEPAPTAGPPGAAAEDARGMSYRGLVQRAGGVCGDAAFELTASAGGGRCTHGPDPAPAGRDVTVAYDGTTTSSTSTTASPTAVPCIGDGTSGPRVQVVYAVASDVVDRFAELAPTISTWAAQMDDAVNRSAAATGGERHLRFVTNPDCSLNVARVRLSSSGDDTFSNTVSELWAAGHSRQDRKYLLYVDATVYCGIAEVAGDDRPDATNPANKGPHYARVDSGCWGRSDHLSELHELMHTLGAVQPSAPHATDRSHCSDESDAMCYADSSAVTLTYPCPIEHEWLLDCGHDDYFSTSPATGSYLSTHWNVANSVFLEGAPVTAAPAPAPEPTTVTTTFSGTLTNKKPTASYALSVGDGATRATLQYSTSRKSPGPLQLRVLASDGTVVAQSSGASPVVVAPTLQRGGYTWSVSGSSSASFTLTVEHVRP